MRRKDVEKLMSKQFPDSGERLDIPAGLEARIDALPAQPALRIRARRRPGMRFIAALMSLLLAAGIIVPVVLVILNAGEPGIKYTDGQIYTAAVNGAENVLYNVPSDGTEGDYILITSVMNVKFKMIDAPFITEVCGNAGIDMYVVLFTLFIKDGGRHTAVLTDRQAAIFTKTKSAVGAADAGGVKINSADFRENGGAALFDTAAGFQKIKGTGGEVFSVRIDTGSGRAVLEIGGSRYEDDGSGITRSDEQKTYLMSAFSGLD